MTSTAQCSKALMTYSVWSPLLIQAQRHRDVLIIYQTKHTVLHLCLLFFRQLDRCDFSNTVSFAAQTFSGILMPPPLKSFRFMSPGCAKKRTLLTIHYQETKTLHEKWELREPTTYLAVFLLASIVTCNQQV